MSVDDDSSAAFESARLQRAGLHHAIVTVEAALAAPAVGTRTSTWIAEVGAALHELHGALELHVSITESATGILGEIVQLAPRLSGPCERLRLEHVELQQLLGKQTALFSAPPLAPDSEWIRARRDDAMRLLGRLANHRQQGADLTYEAYGVDIGGET